MEPNLVIQTISTLGFPIVACIALGWFCRYTIDRNNQNIDRMFEMYDKSNESNRMAIQDCTKAIEKLCEKLEEIQK